MARQAKTVELIEMVMEILERHHPQTLRQIFYGLVSRQATENTENRYNRIGCALVDARKEGLIPWDWIEDRTRRPHTIPMWDDPADFAEGVAPQYRRDVWASQAVLLEVWLEKNALAAIFLEALRPYGIVLNVGVGYDGWSSIYNAAQRWGDGANVVVLYAGDLDPAGADMPRSLQERLGFFGCLPKITKIALTDEDVARYHLPPAPTKSGDTRAPAYIAAHGDICVELDALPIDILQARIHDEVQARMDLVALAAVQQKEQAERKRIMTALRAVARRG